MSYRILVVGGSASVKGGIHWPKVLGFVKPTLVSLHKREPIEVLMNVIRTSAVKLAEEWAAENGVETLQEYCRGRLGHGVVEATTRCVQWRMANLLLFFDDDAADTPTPRRTLMRQNFNSGPKRTPGVARVSLSRRAYFRATELGIPALRCFQDRRMVQPKWEMMSNGTDMLDFDPDREVAMPAGGG